MSPRDSTAVVIDHFGYGGTAEAIAAVPGVDPIHATDRADIPRLLETAPVLLTYRWSDDWLSSGGLRWVQATSTGTEQFPLAEFAERRIALTSSRGIHENQMSEHALGLLLAMTRGIAPAILRQQPAQWQASSVVDLAELTLGILGLGSIGEGLARRARALGMRVIGTKRTVDGYSGAAHSVFPPDQTIRVFEEADAVVVVLPGGDETRGMVGRAEMAALEGGWLVNIGRGSVVDEAALIAALQDGTLAGAGLDVFETEPLPADSPLWSLPNVIITPHIAGMSPHYGARLAPIFAANLEAFHGRGEWVNRVV